MIAGVAGPEVFDVVAEARERLGAEVREEHVGPFGELVHELAALVGADVETDTALAAVVLLDVEVDGTELRADALRHEPAIRITRRRVLDLDDVGTLVS